jgi:transcriptional regulator with XRE-family HTH domain
MSNTSEAAIAAREQEDETRPSETGSETGAAGLQPGGQEFEPKPDVSDQGAAELLPKLLNYFHNNREELARALGLHRSTVDRWLNGKSRPNNSTLLRMRRIAQERRID